MNPVDVDQTSQFAYDLGGAGGGNTYCHLRQKLDIAHSNSMLREGDHASKNCDRITQDKYTTALVGLTMFGNLICL